MYVRANGTYGVSGHNFAAVLNGYLVVDSNGNMQSSSTAPLGVDGSFNYSGTTLTVAGISYSKD